MKVEISGAALELGRIFCVGRNYAAHAAELGNPVPRAPVLFLKPPSALRPNGATLRPPEGWGAVHFEAEIVVLIGAAGVVKREAAARGFIAGLGVGLDLTLRDLQAELKAEGLPWARAKAFDGAAPLGEITPLRPEHDLNALTFDCLIDGAPRQHGDSSLMLYPIPRLLMEISALWALAPGDLIYTGTPAGVGPLRGGEEIEIRSGFGAGGRWRVAPRGEAC
ncbi:fumarylacetoacetate hydrolase family protein [Myxococcota bacterium]|nr:fumarylacetoacetate hydrolase family protein [Myxococcota bacterium]MBU1429959.1 fumarylacetoacetate hydrolase family protein [Myxococcota bacterium]MBU1896822.1 fumarylacetoacetate hydrolase family protein [Myxococcota bacterium]